MDKNIVSESTHNNTTHVDNVYFNLWITNYDPEFIIKAVQRSIHNTLKGIGCEDNAVLKTALTQISLCCTVRLQQISEPDSDVNRSRPNKLLNHQPKKLHGKNDNPKKINSSNRNRVTTRSRGRKQIEPESKQTEDNQLINLDYGNNTFVPTASQNEGITNINEENRSFFMGKNDCESVIVENPVISSKPKIAGSTLKRKLQNDFNYKEDSIVKCKRNFSVDSSNLTNELNVSKSEKSSKENESTSHEFIKRSTETTSNSLDKNKNNNSSCSSKHAAKNNSNKKRCQIENSFKTLKGKMLAVPFEESGNKSSQILDSSSTSVVLQPNVVNSTNAKHKVPSSKHKTNLDYSSNVHCRNPSKKKLLKKPSFKGLDQPISPTQLCTNKYEFSKALPTNFKNNPQVHVNPFDNHLCQNEKDNKSREQDDCKGSKHVVKETEFYNNKCEEDIPQIINVDILMSNSKIVPEVTENTNYKIDQEGNANSSKKHHDVDPPEIHERSLKHHSELHQNKCDYQNNCKGPGLNLTVSEFDKSETEKKMPQIINVDILVSNSKTLGEIEETPHNHIDLDKDVECTEKNIDVEPPKIHKYRSKHKSVVRKKQRSCKGSGLNITVTDIQNNGFEEDSSPIIKDSSLESTSKILRRIDKRTRNNIDHEKSDELKSNNISDQPPNYGNSKKETNVGKIRIKDISTLLAKSESVIVSSSLPEDTSNVEETSTTTAETPVKHKIPKFLLQCFGKKDVRTMKIYITNFNELVESKIEIMGGLLHLGISDALRKQELLKSIEKLCDEQSIYIEKQRLENKFRVSMRQRGIEFTALLGSIVNRFEEDCVKEMFLALYVRLTETLTKIDCENKNHLHLSKNIIHTMLLRNSYKNQIVMSLLRSRSDLFRKAYLRISSLVRFCHSFYTSEDGTVHKFDPIELEEQQVKEGIKVSNTKTLVLDKHLITDVKERDKNSDLNSKSTNSAETSTTDIISNSISMEEESENEDHPLVIDESQENTLDSHTTEKDSQNRIDQTCVKYNQADAINKSAEVNFVNYGAPSLSNQCNGNLIYISTNTPFISTSAINLPDSNILPVSPAHCSSDMLVANKTVIFYALPPGDKS